MECLWENGDDDDDHDNNNGNDDDGDSDNDDGMKWKGERMAFANCE